MPSFPQFITTKTRGPQGIQIPELEFGNGELSKAPATQEKMVSDLSCHLDAHKSMGQDGMRPSCKKEAAKNLPIFSIIYQQSWLTTEVYVAWKLENVIPIYKSGHKEDPGNYRPLILTLVLGNIMEQIILSVTTWHVQDIQGKRPSQHEFTKAGLVWPI